MTIWGLGSIMNHASHDENRWRGP